MATSIIEQPQEQPVFIASPDTRVAIFVNPFSGPDRSLRSQMEQIKQFMEETKTIARIWITLRPQDLWEAVDMAVEWGATEFWVGGGDGTLSAFANWYHLHNLSGKVLFMPFGTACQVAKRYNIPTPLPELLLASRSWNTIALDLFETNQGRTGLLAAGAGLDARAMADTNAALKRVSGELAYYQSMIKQVFSLKPFEAKVQWDGGSFEGSTVEILVANINPFEGPVANLCPQAVGTDATLDLLIFQTKGLVDVWRQIGSVLAGKTVEDPDIVTVRTPWVLIETAEPTQTEIDGDISGFTPLEIKVVPGAMPLLVPEPAAAQEAVSVGQAEFSRALPGPMSD